MKPRFIFAQLITVSSVIFYSFFLSNAESDRGRIANAITNRTAKKICHEMDLVLIGTGGGMMHGVSMKAMSFNCYKEVDLKAARKLVIDCTREYLDAINADKEIRPFLINYPFTEKNVEVVIFFYKPDRSQLPIGRITVAGAYEGKVKFKTDNINGCTLDLLHEETYEEARKIVAADN